MFEKNFFIFLFIFFNFFKSKFGYVLNNCSNLFLIDEENRKILDKEEFILSQEDSYLNLKRICQLNSGEIVKLDLNFEDKNYFLVHAENFYYFDKNNKLLCNFFIEKKNIKILNKKEIEIYSNSLSFSKKAFLKVFHENFLPGKMFFIENKNEENISNEKSKFLECYFFDENFKKNFVNLEKSILEIREDFFYKNDYIRKNEKEIRKNIINYLEFLTKNNDKIIPYVYGGTTIGNFFEKNFFESKKIKLFNNFFTKIYVHKKKNINQEDKAGVDSSGLVNFVLRLFGIPFNLRNTKTFKTFLKKVNSYEELQDGDLLWISGHVLIVNKKDNKFYESNGYKYNCNGIIQQHVSERFKNINSIEDLFKVNEIKSNLTNTYIKEFCFLKSF